VYCSPNATAGLYEAQGAQLTGSLAVTPISTSNYPLSVRELTAGSTITFNHVNGGSGGNFTLDLRYVNTTSPQPLELLVNGVLVETMSVPYTADVFDDYTTTVTLNAGSTNTISFKSAAGSPIFFDSIQID
jgi:hypothetical protein